MTPVMQLTPLGVEVLTAVQNAIEANPTRICMAELSTEAGAKPYGDECRALLDTEGRYLSDGHCIAGWIIELYDTESTWPTPNPIGNYACYGLPTANLFSLSHWPYAFQRAYMEAPTPTDAAQAMIDAIEAYMTVPSAFKSPSGQYEIHTTSTVSGDPDSDD